MKIRLIENDGAKIERRNAVRQKVRALYGAIFQSISISIIGTDE